MFGIGECFHGPAHQALVADIGPEHLRGRYFAVHSLSWGLAGTVGPGRRRFHPRRRAVRCSGRSPRSSAWWRRPGRSPMERFVPLSLRRIPHDEAAIPGLAEPAPV